MDEKEKRTVGTGMMERLIRGQRAGKSSSEIVEGIRAGLGSDHLSLEEGLAKGSTIIDSAKYTRTLDGKAEVPQKKAPLERDITERIRRAKEQCRSETSSPEYRAKVIQQKKAQIHDAMDKRGTNEITSRIRGYNVTLMRISETESTGLPIIKMCVNGNEIPDRQFDEALAEVAGLNDSKSFNVAAQAAMNLKDQASIQGARTATQAGINVATAPAREIQRTAQKGDMMAGQLLGMLFRLVLATSRAR